MPSKIKENEKVKTTPKARKTVAKKVTKAPTKAKKVATTKPKTVKEAATKTAKKSTATKKTTTKKATATKATAKKATAKTTTAKKTTVKKATAKTTTAKKATAKAPAKKTTTKKATAKKTVAKKAPAKKTVSTVEYYDLPYSYDKTMVRVLFQTPKKLFVYWEISEADRARLMAENGKDFFENSTPFLLVKNITKNYSFEIEINDYANSWYFDVPDSKCDYNVELIRKNNYTHIPIQIYASNELEVPNNHILFEQNRYEVFFKNVKTNFVRSKRIVNLHFIQYAGKARPVTLNAFYNKFYDEKDLYNLNNPSSF